MTERERDLIAKPRRMRDEVNIRVDLTVSPSEMRTWRPEVIYRYFAGIAMSLDAVRTGRAEAAGEKPSTPGLGSA